MDVPETLLLLDSASLYFRAYYALPDSMTAPDGHPNNALRGFLLTFARLLDLHGPSFVGCCWDDDWRPAWRVELLASYKTHRVVDGSSEVEEVPDTLAPQAAALGEILDAMGVARPRAEGFEADDCIGTLCERAFERTVVVSGDRDMVQLVDERVRVHLAVNGGMEKWPLLDPDAVVSRYGVRPDQYVDLAILRGDPSDGIPGVPGIGEKTAVRLLGVADSVDGLLRAIDGDVQVPGLTPRLAGLLQAHRSDLAAMRTVATVRRDVPWDGPLTVPAQPRDPDRLAALSEAWGVARWVADVQQRLSSQA